MHMLVLLGALDGFPTYLPTYLATCMLLQVRRFICGLAFLAPVPCIRLQTARLTDIAAGIVGAVVIGKEVSLATSTILLHVAS